MSWIVNEIADRGGSVSFRTFMELALFHPAHGYYSRRRCPQGRGGDYLTAPAASPWYAATLARLLPELDAPLRVVDVGAADGTFLESLRAAVRADDLDSADIGWVTVERSAALREMQRSRFPSDEVAVLSSIDDLPPHRGTTLVHASELYDALPVDRVVRRPAALNELAVGVGDDGLQWAERPAHPRLAAYLGHHDVHLEAGQIAELNLDAGPFHRRVLEATGPHGVAVVLDYGYPARRLYDPRGRRGGSLACFYRHTLGRDPLIRVGDQDITAHVNWDDLRHAADHTGWTEIGLWPLAELLVRAGLPALVDDRGIGFDRDLDAESYAERQEIKRLLDPDGMGSDLRVLVQAGPAVADRVRRILAEPR